MSSTELQVAAYRPCPGPEVAGKPRRAEGGNRLAVLDGLRGIAILSVMLYHFKLFGIEEWSGQWEHVYSQWAGIGWAGVDLFFVLSGFLITGILYQSREKVHYYRNFYARRTVRIFPLYYASLVLFFFAAPLVLGWMHKSDLLGQFAGRQAQGFAWLYLVNWQMGFALAPVSLLMQHYWSLSIEEQFYLVWPFLVLRLERRNLMKLCGGLVVLSFALRVVFHLLDMERAAYMATFCRMDSLAIGAVLALCRQAEGEWRTVRRMALPVAALSASGLALIVALTQTTAHGLWMQTFGFSLLGLFFGGCLVMSLGLAEGGTAYRLTASPVLRFFGKYSYCLYICHQPLIILMARSGFNGTRLSGALHSRILAIMAVNGVALSLTVAAALISWHLFEKQFLKLKELPQLQ
jgi:peptidoglycan/LPS O-acetylase OafA/YrhL